MCLRFALCAAMAWGVAATGCGKLIPCHTPCPPAGAACPPTGGAAACEAPAGTTREVTREVTGAPREKATPRPAAGPPEAPARTREVVQQVERETTVTQDTLLVPRVVYMPYAPYAPTAPVRMRTAELQERVYTEERAAPRDAGGPRGREGAAPRPAGGEDRVLETIDKCSQLLLKMDQRLSELESRVVIETRPAPETRGTPVAPVQPVMPVEPARPGSVVVCPQPVCPPVLCPPAPPTPARRLFNRICPPVADCPPVYCPPVP